MDDATPQGQKMNYDHSASESTESGDSKATLGPIRKGSNLGLAFGLQAMNYAKDLSCYSHWHFWYDLSRCAHPPQRGQLSLNPVMPPAMPRFKPVPVGPKVVRLSPA